MMEQDTEHVCVCAHACVRVQTGGQGNLGELVH